MVPKINEIGTKILITLKEGTTISNLGKAHVIVQNPIRNSSGYGLDDRKVDFVEFVSPETDNNPVITNNQPRYSSRRWWRANHHRWSQF